MTPTIEMKANAASSMLVKENIPSTQIVDQNHPVSLPADTPDTAMENGAMASMGEFEDATSDLEGFLAGLDSILANVTAVDTEPLFLTNYTSSPSPHSSTPLTPSELDTSQRIRRKYGLPSMGFDNEIAIDNMPDSTTLSLTSSNPTHQIRIITETLQVLVTGLMEELVEGGVVESEHPWLEPFLSTLEVILWHGFQRPDRVDNLWSCLIKGKVSKRNKVSSTAVENVNHFSMLKTPFSRIRAWLRLALMSKCLAADLAFLLDHYQTLIS